MTEEIKIEEVHSVFKHNKKNYILFSIKNYPYNYLYFTNDDYTIRALLYGENLSVPISSSLKKSTTSCIECNIGSLIKGGVSLDGGNIVESHLTLDKSNRILKGLGKFLINKREILKLF